MQYGKQITELLTASRVRPDARKALVDVGDGLSPTPEAEVRHGEQPPGPAAKLVRRWRSRVGKQLRQEVETLEVVDVQHSTNGTFQLPVIVGRWAVVERSRTSKT